MSTNDPQQQSMIREAMKAIAERRPGRTKLVYDKTKRTIVAVAQGAQIPKALDITAEDADMFAVVSLSTAWLRENISRLSGGKLSISLSSWDKGDAFTQRGLGALSSDYIAEGSVSLGKTSAFSGDQSVSVAIDQVADVRGVERFTFLAPNGERYLVKAWQKRANEEDVLEVHLVDVLPAIEERRKGLLESSALADSTVLCIGLGTGGAYIAIELAKCGVGNFILVDPDRLSAGNVIRHPGGLSQVGRKKVNVVQDLLIEKNPDVKVSIHPIATTVESAEEMTPLFRAADIVVCGTDNRPSKLIVNKLSVDAKIVALYGGAFRRAYGGQVLRVRPRHSPCYQCFVSAMPEEANDVEIASDEAAAGISYSDRPVPVEPGLSLDVLPIANMLAKLALLELIRAKPSSLNVLQRDFEAPWYFWLNRPEAGTKYSSWPALSESIDEMTIHRWYGVDLPRDENCSMCGDFISAVAAEHGIDLQSLANVQIPSKPLPF